MIELLHDLVKPILSEDVAGTIYMLSGIIFTCWYVPQIVRLYKDTTGAAALSLNTMFFQLCLRFPGLSFFALTMNTVAFWVVAIDMFARIIVLGLAAHKRISFHKEVSGEGSFIDSLRPIDMSKEVIESEKNHLSKMSHSHSAGPEDRAVVPNEA